MARWIRITSKSHTITTKQPLISYSRIDKGKSNSSKTKHKTYEIELNSKPRRAQGELGLLSRSISVQNPQESIPKVLILERRGRNREKRRGRRQEEGRRRAIQAQERKRRGIGRRRAPGPGRGAPVSCAREKKEREREKG